VLEVVEMISVIFACYIKYVYQGGGGLKFYPYNA
jgi:hypothetical protein